VTLKLLGCDGLKPDLAGGEGLAGGFAFEQLAVELEDEEGAGSGFDRPEGAEDASSTGFERGHSKADVFGDLDLAMIIYSFTKPS
jgi:hypothetical protein